MLNRILDSADKLEFFTHVNRDECFELCKNNLNCFQAEWYPKLTESWPEKYDEIDNSFCFLFPVGSIRIGAGGAYPLALTRVKFPGSSIIRCKEKQCHQTASSDNWNGCQPGQRGAFCALSDEKISWPENTKEFNQISRCKQCPKIGPKKERGHQNLEWGKPKDCLQARVTKMTSVNYGKLGAITSGNRTSAQILRHQFRKI